MELRPGKDISAPLEKMEKRKLTFGFTGEFITQITREWFYSGEKSMEKIMETLKDCMTGTDASEARIRRYAEDILLGRAALKGNTADGTYHLERYEPGEEEPLARSMNIWKIPQLRREAEKNLKEKNEQFCVAMEHLTESEQREVRRELGMETREDREQQQIDNYLKRIMDIKEHTTADYGWLEPNGVFHEVEWGEHQYWADKYVEENFPEQYEEIINPGDWLVDRGWVLLHNPSQGVAFATKNPVREYTKVQKEFLYDYYIERDCKDEANALWDAV